MRIRYLTVFNDSDQQQRATVHLDGLEPGRSRELLTRRVVKWTGGRTTLALAAEDGAVIDLRAESCRWIDNHRLARVPF